jgi:magnesium-protoporphyrin O-methyltransferase
MKSTTHLLVDALKSKGVKGKTLLDIGGGIGVIQHELLQVGVNHSINAEASQAYIQATQQEATRQGHADRISHHHGDFVDLAHTFPQTDIVTLDKVICCYDEWQPLVAQSAALARTFYGIVIPRMNLFSRLSIGWENFTLWTRRHPFRTLIHPVNEIDTMLQNAGFKQSVHQNTLTWHIIVYTRESTPNT